MQKFLRVWDSHGLLSLTETKKNISDFIKAALIIQIVVYIAIALDIVILRQIVSFIYLTFIPGLAVLRILRLQKLDLIEKIMFSVGLSIALLLLLGLAVNALYYIGLLQPLSTLPVISVISIVTLTLCAIGGHVNKDSFMTITLSKKVVPYVFFAIFLPILSVSGVLLMNNTGNNILLLALTLIISILFTLSILSKRIVPSKFHPPMLFAISLALLFHISLLTMYLYGFDIHLEYYVFKFTESSSYWNPGILSEDWRTLTYNSMLSVNVLPTIYCRFLNIEGTWIFKTVYPILYSIVPLGLYRLYKKQMSMKVAFFSVFFFMSFFGFFAVLTTVAKQMIGELYFVLLLLLATFSEKEIPSSKKTLLFLIFSSALIVSHYSMSYIYLFYIFFAWFYSIIMKTKVGNITATKVVFFFAIAFSWYIYTSNSAPFTTIQRVISNVSNSFLFDFFNPMGREKLVLAGLGGGVVNSLGHQIGRFSQYLMQLFIFIGLIKLIYDNLKRKKRTISLEYTLMSIISMLILVMCIVLPRFSGALRIERFFHITLLFLAPFCFLGAEAVFNYIASLKTISHISSKRVHVKLQSLALMLIFLSYFLYSVGFVYEVTGDIPSSVALSGYRMDKVTLYNYVTLKNEVFAATWLSNNANSSLKVFCDAFSLDHVLTSYGLFPRDYLDVISLATFSEASGSGSYIFLRKLNVEGGIILGQDKAWNTTEFSPYFDKMNKIYSNGGSEVYKDPLQGPP